MVVTFWLCLPPPVCYGLQTCAVLQLETRMFVSFILSGILHLSLNQHNHYRLSVTVYTATAYKCAIFCILSVLTTAVFCKHALRYSLRQGCWWAEGGAETWLSFNDDGAEYNRLIGSRSGIEMERHIHQQEKCFIKMIENILHLDCWRWNTRVPNVNFNTSTNDSERFRVNKIDKRCNCALTNLLTLFSQFTFWSSTSTRNHISPRYSSVVPKATKIPSAMEVGPPQKLLLHCSHCFHNWHCLCCLPCLHCLYCLYCKHRSHRLHFLSSFAAKRILCIYI